MKVAQGHYAVRENRRRQTLVSPSYNNMSEASYMTTKWVVSLGVGKLTPRFYFLDALVQILLQMMSLGQQQHLPLKLLWLDL